jgi:Kef-type K+ transport system membrane component KefB/voltage-gated potassium channel Kch
VIFGNVFAEFSLVIVIALVLALIVRALKQPIIISYIIAGILVGPYFLNIVSSDQNFDPFAKIGIALLLFVVGLNLNPKVIRHVGKVSAVTGLGQMIFIFASGFLIARFFGISLISSLYIALAVSFSSTIVIMKLLSDKEETETVHGKIATGFLIIQDFVHILVVVSLLAFASVLNGAETGSVIMETLLKGVLVSAALFLASAYILPPITKVIAKSQELLLLFSIGWALGVASIFHYINFSIEVGALLAGVTLSISPFKHEISLKTKPFRDFFLLIFFVWLGSQMGRIPLGDYVGPIIVLSLLVLVGTPIIVMMLMGALGYTMKNSFLTGMLVAQISEFSFIISALGVELGHISPQDLTLIVLIGLVTIAGSSYVIEFSNPVYRALSPILSLFERKGRKIDEGKYHKDIDYEIIVFGYNRIGYSLRKAFKKLRKKFLVVDNNPDVIKNLARQKIDSRYGDAEDLELLEDLPLNKVKMVISTIPDPDTNFLLLKKFKSLNKNVIFIPVSHSMEEALTLYEAGATYVILPHFLGGHHTAHLISKYGIDKGDLSKEGNKNANELLDRQKEGHKDVSHERS